MKKCEVLRIKGNVSEDPIVIMKMMLLLFLDNVQGERELMRNIPERLAYMWFLGYGLDDTILNRSIPGIVTAIKTTTGSINESSWG